MSIFTPLTFACISIDMGEIATRTLIHHLRVLSNSKHTHTIVVHSGLIIRRSSLKNKSLLKPGARHEINYTFFILIPTGKILFAEEGDSPWLRRDKHAPGNGWLRDKELNPDNPVYCTN